MDAAVLMFGMSVCHAIAYTSEATPLETAIADAFRTICSRRLRPMRSLVSRARPATIATAPGGRNTMPATIATSDGLRSASGWIRIGRAARITVATYSAATSQSCTGISTRPATPIARNGSEATAVATISPVVAERFRANPIVGRSG